jgi:ferric-dicitrate binding protein FerR (iron transport regulator)
MSIPDHLIQRFFQGDCTEEERQQVQAFFNDNPEKLAQYLTEGSWEAFTPNDLQEVPTEKIRQAIEDEIGKMPTPVRRIRYGWVAAAAVIALIALFYLLYKNKGDNTKPDIAAATPPRAKPQPLLKDINNASSKTKVFFLPDGSKVALSGNSALSFDSAFINGRRDIFLEGTAVFTVKKDNARPFVVHSKDITTTALGTVFSVSDKGGLFTTVHLFSGRIVIKKEEGKGGGSFGNIYLVPGQQLVINKEDFSVQIKNIVPPEVKPSADPVQSSPQQVLNFTNRPLEEIFSLLQKEYNVSISFDPATLQNMTFTGSLNKEKESLGSFLNTLCDLNELSLKKISDNSFSIQVK